MNSIPLRELQDRLGEVLAAVEAGETIVVTRDGQAVVDLVPHRSRMGLNWEALEAFKTKHGVDHIVTWIADDFDDPLPEDFLLRPLPER